MSLMQDRSDSNKRIAKNTLMLYARMFVLMFVGFYTSRVVLNALGVVDYGVYNVVGGIVGMLSFLNSSMAGATQRWITIAIGEGNLENLKRVFGVGMTAQGVIAAILFILLESVGLWFFYHKAVIPADRYNAAFWVLQISIFTMILSVINAPFNGAIIAHEKMGAFAIFTFVDVIMKLVICFVLHITLFDKLIVYSILVFITFLINFAVVEIYCYRNFEEARFRFDWDRSMFIHMSTLAFWTISGNIAYIGYTQGSTILINIFFGPAMNAAAGVAAQAGNVINQFSSNFQVAMNPQITKMYAIRDYESMHKLIFRSSKFSFYLMLLLSTPLFLEAELLLTLWLKILPDHAVSFLRVGIFISMFNALRNPLSISAMANGDLKMYQFVVNGILLMIAPISYFILKMGVTIPETTSIVYLVMLIIATLASAYMLRPLINLDFYRFVREVFWRLIYITALSYILPTLLYYAIDPGFIRLIIVSISSTISVILTIYLLGMDMSERQFVKTSICKLLRL